MRSELMRCRMQRLIMLLFLGLILVGSSANAGTVRSQNYDATLLASSSDITGSLNLPVKSAASVHAVAEEEEEEEEEVVALS